MSSASRILVTGGQGFVGRALVPKLQQAWPLAEIMITSRSRSSKQAQGAVRVATLDIRDTQATKLLVQCYQPEMVVHLAAQANVGLSFQQPELTWQTNLHGSLNLFAALEQHTPQATLLVISSSDIYGASFASQQALDENALLQPQNPYAASKAAMDLAAGALARTSQLKVLRARAFNHTGPGQDEGYVLPAFAAQIARIEAQQEDILKVGNLDAERDFLHVDDVAEAYVQLLMHAQHLNSGEIFNICSGQAHSVQSLLDQLLSLATQKIQPVADPARMRPSDLHRVQGCATKLKEATGWHPSKSISQTLEDLLNYWRQHIQ